MHCAKAWDLLTFTSFIVKRFVIIMISCIIKFNALECKIINNANIYTHIHLCSFYKNQYMGTPFHVINIWYLKWIRKKRVYLSKISFMKLNPDFSFHFQITSNYFSDFTSVTNSKCVLFTMVIRTIKIILLKLFVYVRKKILNFAT